MEPIRFFVPGNPQGLKRHRSYRMSNGCTVQVDPSKGDKSDFLAKAMQYRPKEPIDEPILLRVICVFQRPKSHFRSGTRSKELKASAPYWYDKTPDWDNCGKFVCDALNGIFWKDDRLIAIGEVDCVYGNIPGVAIEIKDPDDLKANVRTFLDNVGIPIDKQ